MRPSSAKHAKIATVTWPHIAISLRPEKKTALVGPLGLDPQKVVSFGSVSAALNHFFLEVLDEETLGTIRTDDHVLRLISKQHRIDTVCVWCRRGVMTQAFGYGIFVTALVIRKKRHLGRPMQRSPVFYDAPELCRDLAKVALK